MTVSYKGIPFSDRVGPFVRYMSTVNDHRETLQALQGSWHTLSLLGHLSNLKTDMGQARLQFDTLAIELMASLADETLARAISGLGYRAQVAVDILTRNLFERTADIGFLATDADVVAAVASEDPQTHAALRARFKRYGARYSVYRDIVLMNGEGAVLARMENGFDGVSTSDIVQRAAHATFVETFAATDFCGAEPALSYAASVTAERHCGVLAPVFDLQAEARTIFERLGCEDGLMAFLDAHGRVVVSNDAMRLPAGFRPPTPSAAGSLRLGGMTYVAVQRDPEPYQGYPGPGWSALAMLPADVAFESGLVSHGHAFSGEGVFSPQLIAIPRRAAAIQGNLDRVVWNGRLQQVEGTGNDFSRALLEEIAATGRRTQGVFEKATCELLDTVTATMLDETQFLSGLAVDILDRNLYERACDCRWWTENATLAALDPARSGGVLQHINSLYTVYTEILLFDAHGTVLGASADGALVGRTLTDEWPKKTLAVRDRMAYVVSDFATSALYGNRGTYIYSAPIFEGDRAIGGVGLVFDSEPQFEAMLQAALPSRAGSIGAFVRPNGQLVSATATLPIQLPSQVLGLVSGTSWSGMVTADGLCFAVGATAGSGYREFKTSDGYDEQLIALIVVPCGRIATAANIEPVGLKPVARGIEVATFRIGGHVAAVRANEVIECIEIERAVRTPGAAAAGARHSGYTTWRDMALPLVDLGEELDEPASETRHAVVMCHDGLHFGLLVSSLGAIVNLEVAPSPALPRPQDQLTLITHIARSGQNLVPMLSPACVAALSVAVPHVRAEAAGEKPAPHLTLPAA